MTATTAVRDEPSMEEILASIRKIISEQEPEPVKASLAPTPSTQTDVRSVSMAPVPMTPVPMAEVLELTKVLNDDGTITDLASMGEDMLADDFDTMVAEALAHADVNADAGQDVAPVMAASVMQSGVSDAASDVTAALEDVAADLANFEDAAFDQGTFASEAFETTEDCGAVTFDAGISEFSTTNTLKAGSDPTVDDTVFSSADSDMFPAAAPASACTQQPAAIYSESTSALATAIAPAVSAATAASLLSSDAAQRSLSALTELKTAVHAMSQPAVPSVTLEDLTKELLRPMLKSWLDANLPPLVERVVREEIRKITGGDA
jgi:uncharacterized protein